MKRMTVVTLLVGAMVAPACGSGTTGALAAPSHTRLHASCTLSTGGYNQTYANCVTVPAHGKFSISVPNTPIVFQGTGTPATAGTVIGVTQVVQPCPAMNGTGVRVAANGKFPPLKLKKGKAYLFNPTTGRCTPVTKVKKAGIYEVVGAGT